MSHDNYSLSARVYNHIRDGILAGTFAKGDELKEKNIGDELGVSRTPVREALRQLELEGLVSIIPIRERLWRGFPRTISGIYTR